MREFPYGALDCLALYEAIGPSIRFRPRSLEPEQGGSVQPRTPRATSQRSIGGGSWGESLDAVSDNLADRGFRSQNLLRGVFDSLAAKADPKVFDGTPIAMTLYSKVIRQLEQGLEQGASSNLVLTDLAYAENRGRLESALRSGGSIACLNPWGSCFSIDATNSGSYVDEVALIHTSRLAWTDGLSDERIMHEFSAQGAESIRDWGRAAAYQQRGSSTREYRRIIALHVMRDAGSSAPQFIDERPIRDYFEWAELMLETASGAWDEWAIKLHPARGGYRDEEAIVRRLLARHNVPGNAILENTPMSGLLANRVPVFTYSGTIAYEYAARGGLAFTFSNSALADVSVHIGSLDELRSAAAIDRAPAAMPGQKLLAQRNLIGERFSPIAELLPDHPTFPTPDLLLRAKTEFAAGMTTWVRARQQRGQHAISRGAEFLARPTRYAAYPEAAGVGHQSRGKH